MLIRAWIKLGKLALIGGRGKMEGTVVAMARRGSAVGYFCGCRRTKSMTSCNNFQLNHNQ